MRERVILSIANNAVIDREARANAIDDMTRTGDEGFDVGVCFLADYEKFDLDLFIADAGAVVKDFIMKAIIVDVGAVVENFIMRIMSFEMLVIRYSSSVSFIANANIWRRYRLVENS